MPAPGEIYFGAFEEGPFGIDNKRLDQARFVWPRIEDGVMRLSPGQLGALFEGLDWKRVHSRRVARPRLAQ